MEPSCFEYNIFGLCPAYRFYCAWENFCWKGPQMHNPERESDKCMVMHFSWGNDLTCCALILKRKFKGWADPDRRIILLLRPIHYVKKYNSSFLYIIIIITVHCNLTISYYLIWKGLSSQQIDCWLLICRKSIPGIGIDS